MGQRAFEIICRLFLSGSLSYAALIVFVASIHSNFYGFWAHVNYVNDSYYALNWHQVNTLIDVINDTRPILQ